MKIGVIAPPWVPIPPPAYGGTEEFIDELACGLQRAGHEVVLFCTGDSSCPVERRHVFPASIPDRIGDVDIEERHVEHAYRALLDVDVVHDNTIAGPLMARVTTDVPVVVTHHGPFDEVACRNYRLVDEQVALVAISAHQASTARGIRVETVIHHGVDLARYGVGTGQGDYCLFLGRMTADKGAHRAAQIARDTGSRLLIAGKMREPAEYAYFEEQVAPLLGDDVVYLGEVDAAEKVALLGDAVALINPIQWPEPFGLVMIEAMACGTPVLASPCGAAPEIVADGMTGYLCHDHDDFALGIEMVRRIDRDSCRRRVEECFATDVMVERYATLFERLTHQYRAA
jgi:glycosyltransferase involved in cell wall biosynthesis